MKRWRVALCKRRPSKMAIIATDDIFSGTAAGKSTKLEADSIADQATKRKPDDRRRAWVPMSAPCVGHIPSGQSTESGNIVLMFGQGRGFSHCWLDDGTALQDRLPETYVLLMPWQ